MRKPIQFMTTTLLLIAVFTVAAQAQTATATLRGSVSDMSDNVTPGARVTLTQVSTGLKRDFTTGEDGQYAFTFLEPGIYSLEVQAQGFKALRQERIELAVAQNAELNIRLEPGNITDTITVTANETALQLDTASGALGGVVQRAQIDDLPLNGRNVF
jgi:archaellum component FlaG (FlaF/FlaG flagellin family)